MADEICCVALSEGSTNYVGRKIEKRKKIYATLLTLLLDLMKLIVRDIVFCPP